MNTIICCIHEYDTILEEPLHVCIISKRKKPCCDNILFDKRNEILMISLLLLLVRDMTSS